MNLTQFAEWLIEAYHSDDGMPEAKEICREARAALSAQPVEGAVATDESGWLIEHSGEILPGAEQRAQVSWLRVQMKFNGYGAREFGFTHDANEALRFSRREDAEAVLAMHLGASPPDWYSKPFSVTEHMWPAASQAQAAPAPDPSAQAVAGAVATEPDCWAILTPNGSKLVSPDEAKGRKDAYPLYAAPQPQAAPAPEPSRLQKMREAGFTARDTRLTCDECGAKFTPQFAPLHECAQPAPSAQGEPVATVTEEMVTAYLTANDAYWKRIDGEPTKLGKWRNGTPSEATRVSLMAALASAPSTPPPAVVEAVPLTDEQADALRRLWPAIEKAMGCLVFTAEQAGAVQADMNTIRHGIAPKAAQEKT